MNGDCFEGRCFWCAILRIREYVVFAYLARVDSRPNETRVESYWSGA